ncbi:efflux RND transporter periplasmic adaptor subunit [Streptomyces cellostaticus]|uniref:efflux RND transporter periplasmic adaptor subunit n=1 Tax=Streptomyces cellostaticus TaxID=67285 RepID=UPI0020275E18|nr:peptidoglycan-binding protein [Streptomyces cellostaticus]
MTHTPDTGTADDRPKRTDHLPTPADPAQTPAHNPPDTPLDDTRQGPPRTRRPRTVVALVAVAVAVVLGTVGVVAYGAGDEGGKTDKGSGLPPATATVTRSDLAREDTVTGSLGYGDKQPLLSGASGTLTWMPKPGTTIAQGQNAFKVDGQPVPLIYGDTPLYRALRPGAKGPDVAEVERALAALGYTGFTADEEYSDKTAAAVKRWQKSLGVPQTGTVEPADLVVAGGKIRVTGHEVKPGEPLRPGSPVLTYTSTGRLVVIDLDAKKQNLVRRGDAVAVILPDGARAAGTVSSVGKVASTENGGGGPGGDDGKTVIKVTVRIDDKDKDKLGSYDGAPVDVEITSEKKKDVLTVPISALLALSEGGYGVQVVKGSVTTTVAVKTGMFANGRVEITGDGLKAGDKVGVPR